MSEEGAGPVRPDGTEVRIKAVWPEELGPCHIRTPSYTRGRRGQIVRVLGAYRNPEDLAFGRPAALRNLYHVRFAMNELWPDDRPAPDSVTVEIYEHWFDDWKED